MIWRPFIESQTVRIGAFLVVGLLLVASLFGMYYASLEPAEIHISTPVTQYEQQGTFDYRVQLVPNSLFETTQLGPGQVYFARLVDDIRMDFNYHLRTEQLVGEPEYTYQISAILGTPGLWEKTFTLIPPTTTNEEPSTSFVLPIPQFMDLIDTIREETQATTGTPRLTVRALVQPQAQSQYGPISEPFEQTLLLTFEGETIHIADNLVHTQAGQISETQVVPDSGRNQIRRASLAGLVFSLLLLAYLGWMYVQFRTHVPVAEKELARAKKRLKGLLVKADTVPPARTDHVVIQVHSLADLISMAEETYLPVIYTPNDDSVTYCVLAGSGAVRYQYVSNDTHTAKLNGLPSANGYEDSDVDIEVEAPYPHE